MLLSKCALSRVTQGDDVHKTEEGNELTALEINCVCCVFISKY